MCHVLFFFIFFSENEFDFAVIVIRFLAILLRLDGDNRKGGEEDKRTKKNALPDFFFIFGSSDYDVTFNCLCPFGQSLKKEIRSE